MTREWIIQRVFQALITILAVFHLTFALLRLVPGDPVTRMRMELMTAGTEMSPGEAAELVELYANVNPEEPLIDQYISYMGSLFQGDLGVSINYQRPVADIMGGAIPFTVFYMTIAIVLLYVIGVACGAAMAYFEGSRFDYSGSVLSIISNSIPYYVLAIVLVYILGAQMQLFPVGGFHDPDTTPGLNISYIQGVLKHNFLPVMSFVLTGFGGVALSMRANSISVLGSDYVRVSQLRGLPSSRIAMKYVGKNAILPLYTAFMISIGFMFGGSIILEEIFGIPGMGWYMFQAIASSDYPLLMGGFMVIAISVVIGILLADMTYGYIDPRAGERGRSQ